MKNYNLIYSCVFAIFIIAIIPSCKNYTPTAENIELTAVFSNHMVLQRDTKIPVWGKATPDGTILVNFADQSKKVTVDKKGEWKLYLDPVKAGGPFVMEIIGKDTIAFDDVLVGEVWLCSGQSNMEFTVQKSHNSEKEISNAKYDNIRLISVNRKVSYTTEFSFNGEWELCSPQSVREFSAVGYFFGRDLYKNLNIPIGLIHSSWGGTPAEAWTSKNSLETNPILLPIVEKYNQDLKDYNVNIVKYNKLVEEIEKNGTSLPIFQKDTGNEGLKNNWAKTNFSDKNWKVCDLPNTLENLAKKDIDGAVWFRKTIDIPNSWQGKELILSLGSIDDFDITYFNGIEIGSTGKETPSYWSYSRKYIVPASLVKSGKAVIAVRVFDNYGGGGFTGHTSQLKLFIKSEDTPGSDFIALADNWKYKIEKALDPALILGPGRGLPSKPIGKGHPHTPAGLYNGMIFPLAPYAIKGAIWYQGEANAERAYQYRTLLPAMINDWRKLWNQDEFYFGIVQLANYKPTKDIPAESDWAELREAQTMTAENIDNCGLAVAIDIGQGNNIHPTNKQDVGKRLFLWALAKCYNKDVVYSGPAFKEMTIEGNKIKISFSHIADGLKINGDELEGFAISGKDKKYITAKARVEGDNIIVWSELIANPVAVRYAWADNPRCNLYNSADLPAVPFRTDKWKKN